MCVEEVQYLLIADLHVCGDVSVSVQCVSVCVMSVITQDGRSALMYATMWGRTEVVVELVKAGANLNLQTTVCQKCIHVHRYMMYMYMYMHYSIATPTDLLPSALA